MESSSRHWLVLDLWVCQDLDWFRSLCINCTFFKTGVSALLPLINCFICSFLEPSVNPFITIHPSPWDPLIHFPISQSVIPCIHQRLYLLTCSPISTAAALRPFTLFPLRDPHPSIRLFPQPCIHCGRINLLCTHIPIHCSVFSNHYSETACAQFSKANFFGFSHSNRMAYFRSSTLITLRRINRRLLARISSIFLFLHSHPLVVVSFQIRVCGLRQIGCPNSSCLNCSVLSRGCSIFLVRSFRSISEWRVQYFHIYSDLSVLYPFIKLV